VIADLTCDSDGRIDQYVENEGLDSSLPLHELRKGESYRLGFFLVGAYQETLGDIHNLFGDTDAVEHASVAGSGISSCQPRSAAATAPTCVLDYVGYDLADDLRAGIPRQDRQGGRSNARLRASPIAGRIPRSRSDGLHLSCEETTARMSTLQGRVCRPRRHGPAHGWASASSAGSAGLRVATRSAGKGSLRFAAELGLAAPASLADAGELAAHCDVVIALCVTAGRRRAGRCGNASLAANAQPGFVLVDRPLHGRPRRTRTRGGRARMRAVGADFIDAPVSGVVSRAPATANSRSWSAAMKPTLRAGAPVCSSATPHRITHMGPVGAGQNTKAVNQVLVAGIAQAVCEGLALGDALGLDPPTS
jgi:hypothetical protein